VLKGLAGYMTNSMGLISDAMESVVNLASAAFALLMVTIAERPADEDHPYGHHKAEYFSSGFEGMMIIIAAAAIMWAALQRLLSPQPLEQLGMGLALSVLSSGFNGALAWLLFQSAREHRSMALEGDARHLMTDVWTSAGVIVGVGVHHRLALARSAVAIGVAANIVREGRQADVAFHAGPDGPKRSSRGAGRDRRSTLAQFESAPACWCWCAPSAATARRRPTSCWPSC
jgi:cation diffusion facilitator family transporter